MNFKNRFSTLVSVVFLALSPSVLAMGSKVPRPAPSDPQWVVPGLIGEKQQKELWCVAASTRMLMSAELKAPPAQCEIASRVHGQNCCEKSTLKCAQALDVDQALRGFGFDSISHTPDFRFVVESVRRGIPVLIAHYNRAGSADGSGHAVVAYGTYKKGSEDYIVVYDPYVDANRYWSKAYVTGNMAWYATYTLK
jgi:hypothetical protein